MKTRIPTEADTIALSRNLARTLTPHCAVLLHGPLGSGKTTFARALIQTLLGRDETVPSPSFTLLETYEWNNTIISHYDLYRIKNADEISELGLDDALSRGLTIIEWPGMVEEYIASRLKTIHIYFSYNADGRIAEIIEADA